MKLNVDLCKQSATDDLPDQAEYKMFTAFSDITGSNVDDRAANSLGGCDDNIVVFGHLESIKGFPRSSFVEDTGINRFGDGVVDELAKNQTISALIEQLHGVGRNG